METIFDEYFSFPEEDETAFNDVLDNLEPVFSLHSWDADLLDATVKEVVVTDVK